MAGLKPLPILLLVLSQVCLVASPLQAKQRKTARKAAVKQVEPVPVPEAAAEPPAELTLQQQPAVPPEVTYQGGLLTIVARNSTLGDIMRAVRAKTGATIDFPSNTTERVVSSVGPGPAREVLASLLNGSSFNYVIMGGPSDPHGLTRVILSVKPTGPPPVPRQEFPSNAMQQGQTFQAGQTQDDIEESNGEEGELAPEPAEEPNLEQQGTRQEPPPGAIKTPEQLLQELQRQQLLLQQQQQLQLQQGVSPNGQPPEPNRNRRED